MSDNYLLHKRILVVDDEQALLDMKSVTACFAGDH